MKLNFEQFKMPTGVSGKTVIPIDIRESFADAVYNCANGIRAHDLAHKIFKSSGDTEFDEREIELINEVAQSCKPSVIDGINLQLTNNNPNTNN